jgi:hypothetical protein
VYLACRLGSLPIRLNPAKVTRARGQSACLEKSRCPQPLIHANAGHDSFCRKFHFCGRLRGIQLLTMGWLTSQLQPGGWAGDPVFRIKTLGTPFLEFFGRNGALVFSRRTLSSRRKRCQPTRVRDSLLKPYMCIEILSSSSGALFSPDFPDSCEFSISIASAPNIPKSNSKKHPIGTTESRSTWGELWNYHFDRIE